MNHIKNKIKLSLSGIILAFVMVITMGASIAIAVTIGSNSVTSDNTLTLTGTSAAITLGNSSTTSLTVITSDTGTGAVILPAGSIDATEISIGTILDNNIASNAGIALSKLATSTIGNIIIVNSFGIPAYVGLGGDIASISTTGSVALASTGVLSGNYGSSTFVPIFTVDAKGRITSVSTSSVSVSSIAASAVTGVLAIANGGTGSSTVSGARVNLGAAASGANSDITSLLGLTTALPVLQGGTGVVTFTTNGLLYGNATSGILTTTAPTAGQILLGNASGVPAFVSISGDAILSSVGTLTVTTSSITSAKILDGTIAGVDLASNISISTTGTITTTGTGTITSAGLLTASNGITVSTGTVSLPTSSITNGMLAGSIANNKLASPNSYLVVQAHKTSIASLLSGSKIFEFDAPTDLTLSSVQVYVTSITATASVDVQKSGTSVLSSVVTPIANSVATGTISTTSISSGNAITVNVTTNATGLLSDLTVTLIFKVALTN